MEIIEFDATIKDGRIEIPEVYRSLLKDHVHVIVLPEEEESEGDLVGRLLQHPIPLDRFVPLRRGEIYERE